jgi:adenylate kinase family enzyme
MTDIRPLSDLGRRIMVLGLTNSGKSTLAEAIGARTGIPVVHLDRLRHLPDTNWKERPDAEFKALHDAAVAAEAWIMDGSYSRLVPLRLTRVTGMIVLDDSLSVRVRRYIWRSLFQKRRAGGLDGDRDSLRWYMLAWLWKSRNNAERARELARRSGMPYVFAMNAVELDGLYRAWELRRFSI